MRKLLRLGLILAGAILAGAAAGCSTVIFTQGDNASRTSAVEREALIEAAAAISETKWPEPDSMSWRARIAHIGEPRVSKSDAARVYLASLETEGDRYGKILADAAQHLRAAEGMTRAAANAASSVRPVMADISVVEEAIGDLRQARDIYVECLETLEEQGEPIGQQYVSDLKSQFDNAIRELGEAADILADRVAADQTKTFAAPSALPLNRDGSL